MIDTEIDVGVSLVQFQALAALKADAAPNKVRMVAIIRSCIVFMLISPCGCGIAPYKACSCSVLELFLIEYGHYITESILS